MAARLHGIDALRADGRRHEHRSPAARPSAAEAMVDSPASTSTEPATTKPWAARLVFLRTRPTLPSAHIVAWGTLAIVNAVLLALGHPNPGRVATRLLHLYFDGAELLAVGLICSAATAAWMRWGPRRAGWAHLAGWTVATAIGALTLPEDVAVLSDKLAVWGPTVLYVGLLVVAVAAGIPAAAWFGRRSSRGRWRWIVAGAGAAAAAGNHFFVPNDYPAMHLFVAWTAATAIAFSIARAAPRARAISWRAVGSRIALGAVCAWAVVAAPSNAVQLSLARSSSAVVAPWLARMHAPQASEVEAVSGFDPTWFRSRASHPPIAPGEYGLLPHDGIVIVMVIDATRADLFTNPSTTRRLPVLKRFADESIRFSLARTPAPSTTQAVASLMCGRYYSELYWTNKPGRDPQAMYPHMDRSVRYPELLTHAGIDTVHVVGLQGLLDSWGIVHGFEEETFVSMPGGDFAGAERMIPKAIERLRRQPKGRRLYLHMQVADPHAPYNRGGSQGSEFDRYVAEEGVVDAAFGRLLAAIKELGLEDRTIVVVTADHGEAFGEHGHKFHATAVYEEMVRIPLMIRVPHVPPRVIDEPVSLIDVGPTILDLFGLPTPGTFMGQSLAPLLAGRDVHHDRPIIVDSSRLMRAIYAHDGFKLIQDRRKGTLELYDLLRDPGERRNVYAEHPERVAQLKASLQGFFVAHELRRSGYETPYGR